MLSVIYVSGWRKSRRSAAIAFVSGLLAFPHFPLSAQEEAGEVAPPILAPEMMEDAYQLGRNDRVEIVVYGESDLGTTQRLDNTGCVRLPLLGNVKLEGMTRREAEAKLERLYVEERYLRNPQVTVEIMEYAPRFVTVLGEVKNPGKIEFPFEVRKINLIDAISLAGDFTGIAKSSAVRITRINPDETEETFTINVDRIISSDEEDKGVFFVLPGDIIFVPERLF